MDVLGVNSERLLDDAGVVDTAFGMDTFLVAVVAPPFSFFGEENDRSTFLLTQRSALVGDDTGRVLGALLLLLKLRDGVDRSEDDVVADDRDPKVLLELTGSRWATGKAARGRSIDRAIVDASARSVRSGVGWSLRRNGL